MNTNPDYALSTALLPFTSCEALVPLQASNLRMKTTPFRKGLVRAGATREGSAVLRFHGWGSVFFEVIL
jgi:hypothetical protein